MDVFRFRDELIGHYGEFSRSFTHIRSRDINDVVSREYDKGRYWPAPLVQLNPSYQTTDSVQTCCNNGLLHPLAAEIFRDRRGSNGNADGASLTLYRHQIEAISIARQRQSYVVTTGTGSGKSLTFFIPIIDHVLRTKESDSAPRIRAIVIYPMNALANSQEEELRRFLGPFGANPPVAVRRYTGQESEAEREAIASQPPDILLTNFMMLELILTRYEKVDRRVVEAFSGLEFLVLDELHTYRGRQGADVSLLVRRLRQRANAHNLICIGTSATMASEGSDGDRQQVVADVASRIFGTEVKRQHVITETLERVTDPTLSLEKVRPHLREAMEAGVPQSTDAAYYHTHPVAVWLELTIGIDIPDEDRKYRRARPIDLQTAAQRLAQDAQYPTEKAATYLRNFLMAAYQVEDSRGRRLFAFKLHQFISGPGRVWASLEPSAERHVTLDGQKYVPGREDRNAVLYNTYFCRQCGQEYHPVWESTGNGRHLLPREIDDTTSEDDDTRFGFLMPDAVGGDWAWHGQVEDLPDAWLDFRSDPPKVKPNYKHHIPEEVRVARNGLTGSGLRAWYIPGKFRFCLRCGDTHEALGKDVNRLGSLSGEGRSSATTMISLAALSHLFSLPAPAEGAPDPRKILGFSDNRQDAALQAGHFNDLVFLLTLRSGLLRALRLVPEGLGLDRLPDAVFRALGFHRDDPGVLGEYLAEPGVIGLNKRRAQETMRKILGYRLVFDLRRGWRYNNPNLEQLGLLRIDYLDLERAVGEPAFRQALPEYASDWTDACLVALLRYVLDYLRERLCIETPLLDQVRLEEVRTSSYSQLREPWGVAQDERLLSSRYLITSKRPQGKRGDLDYLVSGGARSRLIRKLRTAAFWHACDIGADIRSQHEEEWIALVEGVLKGAAKLGYVGPEQVMPEITGWRLKADTMLWVASREANQDETANPFFSALYEQTADLLGDEDHALFEFEAQEHTAQVDAERRQLLESRFRYTADDRTRWQEQHPDDPPLQRLATLYCSPTMELGVDISALNYVYLRNVPPTPANYAQRSGRAGRSGQPALVVTYCAAQSPHDQYFFSHPERMVYGEVKAPTLDLSNRDLITSHLNAVWLGCSEIELETSIAPMLELGTDGKPLEAKWRDRFQTPNLHTRALTAVSAVLDSMGPELETTKAPWFGPDFAAETVATAPQAFDQALQRWRDLYDATSKQMDIADRIVRSHAVSQQEREEARRRYLDAGRQREALLKSASTRNADFYTYRYLASQGFLPGYNFPRLPLMAWIPASRQKSAKQQDGVMVTRPRFLALAEFGPRSLIYHQGRMYRVVRAMLNVGSVDQAAAGSQLPTSSARVCPACGYGHLEGAPGDGTKDLCEACGTSLTDDNRINALYRIENVATVPVERISINDEERQRQGYDMQTTYRFADGTGKSLQRVRSYAADEEGAVLTLQYGSAATIWRINKGWRRRKDPQQLGFYINPMSGYWSKSESPDDSDDAGEKESQALAQRIVPFVEDTRNILILQPGEADTTWPAETMATLQIALKRGIEQVFQIEESELVAEPLPSRDERLGILLYEAAEGGAGVLTRIATEPAALARVADAALQLMHFRQPDGGNPWSYDALEGLEERDERGERLCEAACYKCLLSYFNQPDHDLIDRRDLAHDGLVLRILVRLTHARVTAQQTQQNPGIAAVDSLGEAWLQVARASGYALPDDQQVAIDDGRATAAFRYSDARALIFFEPPPADILAYLADRDWQALTFPADQAAWPDLFAAHPEVFQAP